MGWRGLSNIQRIMLEKVLERTGKGVGRTSAVSDHPYSTADVKVTGATLVSNHSEGVCIERTGSRN